jgi:hypothetical protein
VHYSVDLNVLKHIPFDFIVEDFTSEVEVEGEMFLRNTCKSIQDYTASQSRIPQSVLGLFNDAVYST